MRAVYKINDWEHNVNDKRLGAEKGIHCVDLELMRSPIEEIRGKPKNSDEQ